MTTLYVILARAGRVGIDPKSARVDLPVNVPDRSEASYDFAREEAQRMYCETNQCAPERAYVIGVY